MAKFKLAFGIHNHQPVGNFEAVFDSAHRSAYKPFLDLVRKYPAVRLSLHQSGILWQWQKARFSDYFEQVGRLIDSGQVELMTGGYYEPILISIPERDAAGQIAKLTDYLTRHFDIAQTGLWLTERIWEPHLPKLLAAAGIKYLPIDDTHFVYAGMTREQLTGPFATEHEGHIVTLLPIQKRLRYLIPFGTVEKVIDELRRQADRNPEGLAVYADDGEKFGVWPNTFEHCFTDGWLESFFDAIGENSDWLEMITLGEAAQLPSAGRAYLPSASYAEMLHWSLPPDAFVSYEEFEHKLADDGLLDTYGQFVRGGHWRGFLAKYDESNLMHKKMLSVSDRLDTAAEEHPELAEELAVVRDRLYAGQCNCPYWHGVFGGLYLPHIRQAIYANLIEAEARLRKLLGEHGTTMELTDYDAEGNDEAVVRGDTFTAVIKPRLGGNLIEYSALEHNFSLTDTLTRRREGYHRKLEKATTGVSKADTASIHDLVLAKEEGLNALLVDDWYLKRCFIDHFIGGSCSLEQFQAGHWAEEGDFILEPFTVELDPAGQTVNLARDGHIWRPEGVFPVRLEKRYRFFEDTRLEVAYRLSTTHTQPLHVLFAVENNFNFQAGHAEDRFVLIDGDRPENSFLDSPGSHRDARVGALVDEYRKLAVAVTSDQPAELWHMPIFTVSLSEGGFEKVYQGTTLLHRFRFTLTQQPIELSISLAAGDPKTIRAQAAAGAGSVSLR
jgi:alpha-amylase